ncbi:TniB family NTP-binding protein [Pseudomonas aeruginosa]|uniref:TniB family NTP-binding protein n=1 Tax=Pseudomonas aeruginosa TaxID=287 RepID=UPI0029CA48A6|nr:TniB family NTP-binding protein [Pseudomonas aeruginosa]HEJ3346681.1 TniB family NTP-binding protein [Pseudomonas aeruginosa]
MKEYNNFEHISPALRKYAKLGDKERIRNIYKDCWVNYPQVGSVRAAVRSVYEMPPKTQAQCMLIAGHPGMGKTSLFKRIESDMEVLRKRHVDSYGCISFSLSPDPNLHGFEDSISEALGVPIGKIRNGLVPEVFCRLAHLRRMRLVLIDEVHNLLNAGRIDQRKNLAFLRALSSPPMSLSIIAFGVEDAVHAISSDAQLERRFQMYSLPRWKENENFRSFLAGYESSLPLRRPSELARQEKVRFLLGATGGITDAIVKRITRGAVWAILDGKEEIDIKCLEKAAEIPPYPEDFNDEK